MTPARQLEKEGDRRAIPKSAAPWQTRNKQEDRLVSESQVPQPTQHLSAWSHVSLDERPDFLTDWLYALAAANFCPRRFGAALFPLGSAALRCVGPRIGP